VGNAVALICPVMARALPRWLPVGDHLLCVYPLYLLQVAPNPGTFSLSLILYMKYKVKEKGERKKENTFKLFFIFIFK